MSAFAQRISARDPEGAATWAITIGDEKTRTSAVENVARGWLKKDANAARKWIQATPSISEEVRERLLTRKDG